MTLNGWRTVALSELCLGIFDGPHATPKKAESGPVFLGISNLVGGRLDLTDTRHLSEEDFAKWTRRVTPQPGDIVFSYETRLGEAAIIPERLRCCLGRRMGLLRPDPTKVNPRYLLYAYLGPEFQETLRGRAVHGSTVDRILLSELGSYPMRYPPLDEQEAIAGVLASLDDKIELNGRMTQTLEAIALAIFKSRFADFDSRGSRSRMERRGATQLGNMVTVERELVDPSAFPDEIFDHYSIPAYDFDRRPSEELGRSIRSGKFLVPSDSVLVSKLNPRIPRVWLPFTSTERRSISSTEFIVLRPRPGFSREYLYLLVSRAEFLDRLAQMVGGTSGSHQRVKVEDLVSTRVTIPKPDAARAFTSVISPMFELVRLNLANSSTLSQLRDSLLPRLVSGSLRVGYGGAAVVTSTD